MKNLKNLMMGVVLAATLMIGTGTVNAGVLLSELNGNEPQPCTETKEDWGIIVQDIIGIVVQDFGGIIVQDGTDTETNCGIVVQD